MNLYNTLCLLYLLLFQIFLCLFLQIYNINSLLVFHIMQILCLFLFSILLPYLLNVPLLLLQNHVLLDLCVIPLSSVLSFHKFLCNQVTLLNSHHIIVYLFFPLLLILILLHIANELGLYLILFQVMHNVYTLMLLCIILIFHLIISRIFLHLHLQLLQFVVS